MPTDFHCKLASFDLDGTLVPNTSSGGFLAEKLGHAEAMHAAEARYSAGLVGNDYVSTMDGSHYKGLNKQQIFNWLEDIPQIAGIAETVAALQKQQIPCVICTLAWEFVAEFFAQRYGFEAWSGPRIGLDNNGQFTGLVEHHFNEFDKPIFIQNQCDLRGIAMANVFHIGDSRSDIELFKQAGFSIAINATADAVAAARTELKTENLTEALALIPNLNP